MGRVEYVSATDDEAVEAFQLCSQARGHHSRARIVACLAPRDAKLAPTLPKDNLMVMNLSGRGDKDIFADGRAPRDEDLIMSRIEKRFAQLKADKRAGLVTYITAGDPDTDVSYQILKGLPAAGADLIELGMPFTDPMADGPSIQLAGQRALKAGRPSTWSAASARRPATTTRPFC
jgi:hypothetical protein